MIIYSVIQGSLRRPTAENIPNSKNLIIGFPKPHQKTLLQYGPNLVFELYL